MDVEEDKGGSVEPGSPTCHLMQQPVFNVFILGVLGYSTSIDVQLFKHCLSQTLVKHPRFSSLLVKKKGKRGQLAWKRAPVDLESHVFVPDLDPNMDGPDEFLEEFTAGLSKTPMDSNKPLWEVYILNVKSSDAHSTVIFKIDHSVGDGVSLIALVLACSKKVSDPHSLPMMPTKKHQSDVVSRGPLGLMKSCLVMIRTMFWIAIYTLMDCFWIGVTIFFVKDSRTPLKGSTGVETSPKRFIHRVLSLDDVKLVKNALNASINDVILGATEAGINRYLNMTSVGKAIENNGDTKAKPKANPRRVRMAVAFNLRQVATIKDLAEIMEKGRKLDGMWGNKVGLVLIPLKISNFQEDPITYVNRAKATMERKKLSLAPHVIFSILKLIMNTIGIKAAAAVTGRVFHNSTMGFSNVMGPNEEVCLFGHHLAYISPTVYGFPQSLVIHYQSYCNKLVIALSADEKLIPNPHQLCDELEKSLETIKDAVIKRGLVAPPHP